jgi:hypothetical protein
MGNSQTRERRIHHPTVKKPKTPPPQQPDLTLDALTPFPKSLQLLILSFAVEDVETHLLTSSRSNDLIMTKWFCRTYTFPPETIHNVLLEAQFNRSLDTTRWLLDTLHPVPQTHSLRSIVLEAFAIDKAHRYPGVRGDLFLLEDLKDDLTLDGSVPVLEYYDPYNGRPRTCDLKVYRSFALRTFLQDLDGFDMKGLVIAGGAVCSALYKNDESWKPKDVDVFLVGLSKEEAIQKIEDLAVHLHSRTTTHSPLIVQRSPRTLSFGPLRGTPCLQIILRLFSTISEVLHCFDLGASAVADDGKQLYFTTLGKVAHERRLNVLDLTRRQISYEYRICKYLTRGFRFALPGFDFVKAWCHESWKADQGWGAHQSSVLALPYLDLQDSGWNRSVREVPIRERRLQCIWARPHVKQTQEKLSWFSFDEERDDKMRRPRRARRRDLIDTVRIGYGAAWYTHRLGCTSANLEYFSRGKLERMCAYSVFSPGVKVTEIQPTFPFSDLCDLWTSCSKENALRERYLFPWMAKVFEDKEMDWNLSRKERVTAFCKEWGKRMERCASFAFEFSPIMDQYADIGFNCLFPASIVTPQEWLGDYFLDQ